MRLFDFVRSLRAEGLSYGLILKEVQDRYGIRLYKSHVSVWVRRVHSPYNGRYIPSADLLEPSEELAYVIGVILGDGYAISARRAVKSYINVKIGLGVKDKEFALEFARCISKVLGRPPIRPKLRRSIERYVVEVGSRTLYELLKKPADIDRLRPYIEHCKRCMAAFLRGFIDSEGCVDRQGYIRIINTDLQLLQYVKELLQRLGIEATGPRPKTPRGTPFYDPRTGKMHTKKKDVYRLRICAAYIPKFYQKIGLTIERKKRRLEEYIRRRRQPLPHISPCFHLHGKNPTGPLGLEPRTSGSEGRRPIHARPRALQV